MMKQTYAQLHACPRRSIMLETGQGCIGLRATPRLGGVCGGGRGLQGMHALRCAPAIVFYLDFFTNCEVRSCVVPSACAWHVCASM